MKARTNGRMQLELHCGVRSEGLKQATRPLRYACQGMSQRRHVLSHPIDTDEASRDFADSCQ